MGVLTREGSELKAKRLDGSPCFPLLEPSQDGGSEHLELVHPGAGGDLDEESLALEPRRTGSPGYALPDRRRPGLGDLQRDRRRASEAAKFSLDDLRERLGVSRYFFSMPEHA